MSYNKRQYKFDFHIAGVGEIAKGNMSISDCMSYIEELLYFSHQKQMYSLSFFIFYDRHYGNILEIDIEDLKNNRNLLVLKNKVKSIQNTLQNHLNEFPKETEIELIRVYLDESDLPELDSEV